MTETTAKRLRLLAWFVTAAAVGALLFYAYRRYVLLHPDPTLTRFYKGTKFELLNPRMLGVVMVAPWFVLVLSKSLADLPLSQRILSVILRILFVLSIGFGLSRLAKTSTQQKVATVYVVDVSDSVTDESLGDAQRYLERAWAEKPKDGVIRVVTFAKRPRLLTGPSGDLELAAPPALGRHADEKGDKRDFGAGSNVQAALQLAYGLYPPGFIRRAVVLTDGVQTDGDLLAESNRARDFGVKLYSVPFRRPAPPEVAVRELRMPDRVKVGETFEIHADLYATRATKAEAKLYQGEALNGLEGVKLLDLKAGPNDIVFKSVVRTPGAITYAFELDKIVTKDPDGKEISGDRFKENNRYAQTIDVPGRPQVLYIEGTPAQSGPLSNALVAQQYDVDMRPPAGFPGSLKELERFDFVIVSDTPKEAMSLQSQELIEAYVRDLGGGFLFAGGESGYGLGGWYHTTMERILPVRMDNERKQEMPSVALALVIDRSGSMSGLPMEMAKAAAKATAQTLAPDDLIEVIAFDSQAVRYVKMQQARNRTKIAADIARIQPGGGTEIFPGLDMAFQDLSVVQARKKHVILLTDGVAPPGGIRELVSSMVAESMTVTTVGLGSGIDESLLRMISDVGGGRFHNVPDPNNLPKIFTKETEMIARQAAVEEWFQVAQVGEAPFLRGIDVRTAPYLHGYVSTKMKPAPAQELLQSSDTEEPILARWRVGLGWTLAWTSDVKSRWAVEWLKWPGWERFWGQLVREHMRQKHRRELDMKAEIVAGELRASVDGFTPDERFENGLVSKLTIIGPEQGAFSQGIKIPEDAKKKIVDMRQVAPGRYEAVVPMDKYGSFLLRAEHSREQPDGTLKPVAVSYGHVSNPYPREYAAFEPDVPTLEKAAVATGGVLDPASIGAIVDPGDEKMTYHEDLWNKSLLVSIILLLLDLFVRRVRLFDRKFLPKKQRGGPFSLGPRSTRGGPQSMRPGPSSRSGTPSVRPPPRAA
jgi:Ca-activated chloride channel family protein